MLAGTYEKKKEDWLQRACVVLQIVQFLWVLVSMGVFVYMVWALIEFFLELDGSNLWKKDALWRWLVIGYCLYDIAWMTLNASIFYINCKISK